MKQRNVIVLLLIAAMLVAVAVSRMNKSAKVFSQGTPQGTPVLTALSQGDVLNSVAKIELIYPASTVIVQRIDGVWSAPEEGGYPVQFSSVADFLRLLAGLEIGQVITVNPEQWAELDLTPPGEGDDSSYTRIVLYDETGKTAAELTLGKQRAADSAAFGMYGADGRYAKAGDVVSVVTESFYTMPHQVISWINTSLLDVAPDSIKILTVQEAEQDALTFTRGEDNVWGSPALGDKATLDDGKVNRLAELFQRSVFSGVVARDEAKWTEYGLDKPTVYTAQTADGTRITLSVGRAQPATGNRYAVVEMQGMSSSPEPTEEAIALQQNISTKNEQFKKWVYLLPPYLLSGVFSHRDDYIKPAEPAPAITPEPAAEITPPIPE